MRRIPAWTAVLLAVLSLMSGCGRPGRLETNADPTSLVLDASRRMLYVACEGSQTVEAWDLRRRVKLAEAEAGRGPLRLVLDQAGNNLYVLCAGDRLVLALRVPDLKPVRRLRLSDAPSALWEDVGTRSMWVACADSNLLRPYAGSNPLPAIETGQEPADLARAGEKDFLWVANRQGGNVSVVKLSEGQVVKQVGVWPNPRRLLLPGESNRLLVLCQGQDAQPPQSRVQTVDTLYQSAGLSWPAGVDARDFALSPDERRLYVLTRDNLLVLASDTGAPLAQLKVGKDPRALAIAPDESLAFVSCRGQHEVMLLKLTPQKWLP
jgi:DNA-binding beta-propeller fold protein YncE